MKKILTSLALLGAISFTASAQKACDLELETMTNSTSVAFGDTAHISFKLTNNGSAAMAVTDTVFYGVVGSNQVFRLRLTAPIASGASSTFTNQLFLANDSAMAVDLTQEFCFVLFDQSIITVGGNPFPVTYADNNAANDTSCVTITLKKSATSIFDVNAGIKESLKTYPNPTHGSLNFEYNFEKATTATARISDITGRTVLVKEFGKNSVGTRQFSLDVSALNAGTYIIEFLSDDKRAISKFTVN